MIELVQCPWSPFCIVQRRILEHSGARFKLVNVAYGDRSLIWEWSKGRYYEVPILKDGSTVIFETSGQSQVIAKYLDNKLRLNLFPNQWRGLQMILWRYIEEEVEGVGSKLNDIYWQEFIPPQDEAAFVRHKERKFGRGCLDEWKRDRAVLLQRLSEVLVPFEHMLLQRPFLLEEKPNFVDFDLFGVLGSYLYSGHNELPAAHTQLQLWYNRMLNLEAAPAR